jgi:hypothetical protein
MKQQQQQSPPLTKIIKNVSFIVCLFILKVMLFLWYQNFVLLWVTLFEYGNDVFGFKDPIPYSALIQDFICMIFMSAYNYVERAKSFKIILFVLMFIKDIVEAINTLIQALEKSEIFTENAGWISLYNTIGTIYYISMLFSLK